jgi:hypothetical protein
MEIEKHPQHSHFFIENEVLMESYKTLRGPRSAVILILPDHPDIRQTNPKIFDLLQHILLQRDPGNTDHIIIENVTSTVASQD